jgi:ferredoxin
VLSLYNAVLIHHESLIRGIRCRFATCSAHVFCTTRDPFVFHLDVLRQNPTDDRGNDSEQLYENDQHESDSEDAGDWVNCGGVVERVDDAVGGSNGGEG